MTPRLQPRERLLLTLIAGLVAAALLVVLVFRPALRDGAAAWRDARRKQSELVRMTALAQQREEIERRHAEARDAGELLLARIPPEPDLPDLITQLDSALSRSGVVLMQVLFQGELPASGADQSGAAPNVGSLPVQLRVLGTYPQLRALVAQLEVLPRVVVIDRLALTGTETGIVADVAVRALFLR